LNLKNIEMENEFKPQPYPLSIIPIIKEIELNEVFFMKKIIKATEIPANPGIYDDLIKLWKKRMAELSFLDSTGVIKNLEERKKMIEKNDR
jgi:hypothetical protein